MTEENSNVMVAVGLPGGLAWPVEEAKCLWTEMGIFISISMVE